MGKPAHSSQGATARTKVTRREQLYKEFVEEASKLYADSLIHEAADVSQLIKLYSLISLMRVLSPLPIVETAEKVTRMIVNSYLAPNKTFPELRDMVNTGAMYPVRDFSQACREEFQKFEYF